jgi:hypothetical protein
LERHSDSPGTDPEWQALGTRKPDRDPAPAGLTLRRRELLRYAPAASLRYPTGGDDWQPLVGKMLESTLKEQDAREELKKWQPVRRHTRDFTHRDGIAFNGSHLQLYARVFTLDLYQFGWNHHSQAGEQDVAFVLTLWSGDASTSIYNSTVNALRNFVESAA